MSDKLRHKKWPMPTGCNIKELVMRETSGLDEQQAALLADNGGGNMIQELIRLAIVSVDGERVAQPYIEMDGWNTKTRRLVIEAFGALNDVQDEELAVFKEAGEDIPAP